MKNKLISFGFGLIFIYIIFFNNSKVFFASKNPYQNTIIGEIKVKGFYNFYSIEVLLHDIHQVKICSITLPVTYDCDYDIYEDIDSIKWKLKEKFQIKTTYGGRLYNKYKSDFLYLNNKCQISTN